MTANVRHARPLPVIPAPDQVEGRLQARIHAFMDPRMREDDIQIRHSRPRPGIHAPNRNPTLTCESARFSLP